MNKIVEVSCVECGCSTLIEADSNWMVDEGQPLIYCGHCGGWRPVNEPVEALELMNLLGNIME